MCLLNFDIDLSTLSTDEKTELQMILNKSKKYGSLNEGDEFFYILPNGEVHDEKCSKSSDTQIAMKAIGNQFRYKCDADIVAKRLLIEERMRTISRKAGRIDWLCDDRKYFITVGEDNKLNILHTIHVQTQGTIYFPTKASANNAVALIGIKNLLQYAFGRLVSEQEIVDDMVARSNKSEDNDWE